MLCCIPCPRAPVRTSDKHDECWSSTWEEARTKFRAAASACGATLEAIPYDSREGFDTVWAGHAPEGGLPELTIDVAIIGDAATASSLLLHTSGTHGVEGYAGSAIQIDCLRRAAAINPPPGVAIVLVHALNALGMAEGRRWNERGVDLNRNYVGLRQGAKIPGTDLPISFDGLASLPYAKYHNINSIVNPMKRLPTGCCGAVEFAVSIGGAVGQHGFAALKQAVAGGHYGHQSAEQVKKSRQPGLFFGGHTHEQSVRLLHEFLGRLGRQRSSAIQRATHVDVHTGLGPSGHDTVLCLDTEGQSGFVTDLSSACASLGGDGVAENLENLHGKDYHVEIIRNAETGGTGYTAHGMVIESSLIALSEATPGGVVNAAAFAQEFGTSDILTVIKALREDGALIRDVEAKDETLPPPSHVQRRALRDAFYPEHDAVWKSKILSRGRALLEQNAAWLSAGAF